MDKKGNGSHWLTRTVSIGETVFVFCLLVVALVTAGYYGMHGSFSNFASVETASPLTLGVVQNGTRIQASGTKSTGSNATIYIFVAPAGQPIGSNTGTGITGITNAPDGAWKSNYIDGYLSKTGFQQFVPGTNYVVEAMMGSQIVKATISFSASGTPAATAGSTGEHSTTTTTPPPTTTTTSGDHPVATTPPPPTTTTGDHPTTTTPPPTTTPPTTTPPVATTPAPTGLAVGAKVYTTTSGVTLRSSAGTTASAVSSLAANVAGTIVSGPTTATNLVWYQVKFGERTGWVTASYLSTTAGGVAVTPPPTTTPPTTTPPVTTPPVTTPPTTTPPTVTPPPAPLPIPTAGIVFLPTIPQPTGSQIVGGLFQNAGGSALPAHALSFGQSFHLGSVPGNSDVTVTVNGSSVPAQMDVETTAPDGSARFGVITVLAPSIAANASVPFMISAATKSSTPLSLSSMPGYSLSVSVNVTGGGSGSYLIDAPTVLQAALTAGKVTYWRQGPIVTEGRVDYPITSSLHVTLDIAKYQDGSYSTDVQFNNDYALQPVGGTVTYDVSVSQNNSVVFSRVNIPQLQYTAWHKQFWSNGAPGVNIVHDVDYLERTNALPDFDLKTGVDGALIASYAKSLTLGKGFDILGNADLATYMGATGGRPDIGFTTEANADWLVTQNPITAAYALAQADAAGSVPWHIYDPKTGKYVNSADYPNLWEDGRNGHTPPTGLTQDGYTPAPGQSAVDPLCQRAYPAGCFLLDQAHQPDLSYIPFLLTGLRYYGDGVSAQATWDVMGGSSPTNQYRQGALGLVVNENQQTRGRGWSLRQLVEAAFIIPDKDPLKSYFPQIVANNINYLTSRAAIEKPAQGQAYGWVPGMGAYSPGDIPPWQQEYLYYAVILAAKQGVAGAASYLNTFMNNFIIDRWVAGSLGFSPYDADDYTITVASDNSQTPSTFYTTWAQVQAGTIKNGASTGGTTFGTQQFRLTYLTSRGDIAQALNLGMDAANAQNALNWIGTYYKALDVPFAQGNARFNVSVRPGGPGSSLGVASTNSNLAAAESAPVPHHFWASIMSFFASIGKFLGLA